MHAGGAPPPNVGGVEPPTEESGRTDGGEQRTPGLVAAVARGHRDGPTLGDNHPLDAHAIADHAATSLESTHQRRAQLA